MFKHKQIVRKLQKMALCRLIIELRNLGAVGLYMYIGDWSTENIKALISNCHMETAQLLITKLTQVLRDFFAKKETKQK